MSGFGGVAVYLRKSRADSAEESVGETLTRHRSTLLEFARRNSLSIIKIYQEVVSGDSLAARPEMIGLLQDVEEGKYGGVLCMDIDRLGRGNMRDMGIILETLKAAGTRILTPRKAYDLNDELDEFSTEIQSLVARQELKNITRRMQQGKRKSVSEGSHINEPPFGYRREYQNKKPTLRIEENEARIVRMIFDMYVNQSTGAQLIAEKLNAMGIKPRRSEKFSRSSVKWLLENPVYSGRIVWNRKSRIKGKNSYRVNPKEEWVDAEGMHPAIISPDIFKRAQEIRKNRTHPPYFTGMIENPLAGIVFCQKCGSAMIRQYQKGRKYQSPRLLCPAPSCCRSTRITHIEEYVLNFLRETLDAYRALEHELPHETDSRLKAMLEAKSRLLDEMKSVAGQKNRLYDFLEQNVYDIDTFTRRSGVLTDRERAITAELVQMDERIENLRLGDCRAAVIPKLEYVVTSYESYTPPEKNSLLKSVFKRAEYYKSQEQRGNAFTLEIQLLQRF